MKKLLLALSLTTLCACTTLKTYDAAPQSHRIQGSETAITINGKIDQKLEEGFAENTLTSELSVYFNGDLQIHGFLDKQVTGEIPGSDYEGKKTSASCSTKWISKGFGETRCIIFIGNERAATLQM